jgi:hypothetical protein
MRFATIVIGHEPTAVVAVDEHCGLPLPAVLDVPDAPKLDVTPASSAARARIAAGPDVRTALAAAPGTRAEDPNAVVALGQADFRRGSPIQPSPDLLPAAELRNACRGDRLRPP